MTTQNSIFLISDNPKTACSIQEKIMLLRNKDDFIHIDYKNAFEKVKIACPSVIFYDTRQHEKDFLSFINKVKQSLTLINSSVIALYDKINEDFICSAFESGIADFLSVHDSDSEFTIRTLWAIRNKNISLDYKNKLNILSQLKIIDALTGIYTKNYTYTVLKEESKKTPGSLAVIAPDVNTRNKMSLEQLALTVKRNIRLSDTIGFYSDFKLCIWFPETTENKIISILEKIKKQLPSECTISAGIAQSGNYTFEEQEQMANKALTKALLRENSFSIASEKKEKEEDSVKKSDTFKNFKLFKENFHKKFEGMISPVFYRTQKIIEEKLFETKIEQEINENESFFHLCNAKCNSLFKITYPGYTKININISHNIDSEIFENKMSMDLNEIDKDKVSVLLDDFIKDFQKFVSC